MKANDILVDSSVRHAVYLARYKAGLVKRMINLLAEADRELVALLRRRNVAAGAGEERIQKLLKAVREQQAIAWGQYRAALKGELNDLAVYEVDFLARSIRAAVPSEIAANLAIVAPARSTLYSIVTSEPMNGRFLRDWAAGLERDQVKRVEAAIRQGIVQGEAIDRIVARVAGTKAARYRDGALAISRRNAEAITRTAVNHVTTRARDTFYQSNADLVKGWMFVATLDTRTTPICQDLDGKVYKVGEGPRPPQHINCRSTTAPVLGSWKDLGLPRPSIAEATRASMDGQVPASLRYGDWLRGQTAAVQREALGPTKAALFREGKLDVSKFVDRRTGRQYTLAELAKREGAAFRRAGLKPSDFG